MVMFSNIGKWLLQFPAIFQCFYHWNTIFSNNGRQVSNMGTPIYQCWHDSVQHWTLGHSNIWQCNQQWNFAYSNTGQVLHPHWDVKLSSVGQNISNTGYMHNPTSDNSFPTLDHRSVPLWMNCFPHTGLIHFPIRQSPSILDCYIFNIWTALTSNGKFKNPLLEIV